METLAPRGGDRRRPPAGLVTRRVVVTGPESTGKTTLAVALASRLKAPLVAEAARAYAEEHADEELTAADVAHIARNHVLADDAALTGAPPLIVFDTDLISTVVYARHYYGSCPAWIEAEARARRGDRYLLCDIDLPWQADGVRDRPLQRELLLELFRATLHEFGARVVLVEGNGDSRLDAALAAVAA